MATISSISPPPWNVIEFTFSNLDADAELVVMCNHVRFVIHVTETGLASSPPLREKHIFFLSVAENHELDGCTVDDFYDWALEPLLPVLCEQTRELKAETATLHDFLYAPILEYSLEAKSNKLVLRPQKEHAETRLMFGVSLPDRCQLWPCYLPSEIQLDEEAAYDSTPRNVFLPDNTVAFFKLMGRGEKRMIESELLNYKRIRTSRLSTSVRISRLLGLVHDDSDTVFGLLLTHIDCKGQTMTCAIESGAPESIRRQWTAEITQIIYCLHQNGLVWGDAKPDNVLIDGNQNALIIDFGGGYSEGWVPKDLAGTVKRDLVALAKIVDYAERGPVFSL
ncbi:hypothetical protein MY10362_002822 [Beauveria mimosiformis]